MESVTWPIGSTPSGQPMPPPRQRAQRFAVLGSHTRTSHTQHVEHWVEKRCSALFQFVLRAHCRQVVARGIKRAPEDMDRCPVGKISRCDRLMAYHQGSELWITRMP